LHSDLLNYLIIFLYILAIFTISLVYKILRPLNKEFLRKIIHIGIGPIIPLAQYLQINQSSALIFTGLISVLILTNYKYRIITIIEDVDRKSFGTFFYCLSLFIMILCFWEKDPLSLITGFFIMTFGDGLAALIGKNIKSKKWYLFNQQKSLLGTLTMFTTSFIILLSINYVGGYTLNLNILIIALLSTFLEQVSIFGIDNLTVPIFASISFNLLVSNT